jgi:3-oxoadipate enol-lactonase
MPQLEFTDSRCHYRLEGDRTRPVLVLLHPIGSDLSLWDKVVPELTQRFCVLRYDLRGHGASGAPTGPYSLDMLVADLAHVIQSLRIASVHLCGISLGGMVACAYAAAYPAQVRSLVVTSTAVKLAPPPGGWDARAQAVLRDGMSPFLEGMLQRMVSEAHRRIGDPAVGTLATVFETTKPGGYASACAVLRDVDLAPLLPSIQASTLILTAEDDALVRQEAAVAMAALLPRSEHRVMKGGHFPPLEQPAAFLDEIRRWCEHCA